MSRITKAASLLFTIVALVVFSNQPSAAESSKEIGALQAPDQNRVKAYTAGNAEAVASLYDE